MSYIQLWHKIQNLIDSGEVIVGNYNKNSEHQAFKDPFPPHEKGEYSTTKNAHTKVNYTYNVNDNVINMVKPIGDKYCGVITIKGREDIPQWKTPFILQELTSTSKTYTNVVTHSQEKFILKGPEPSITKNKQSTDKTAIGTTNKNPKSETLTNTAN